MFTDQPALAPVFRIKFSGYHLIIQRNFVWNNKTLVHWDVIGKLSEDNGIKLRAFEK